MRHTVDLLVGILFALSGLLDNAAEDLARRGAERTFIESSIRTDQDRAHGWARLPASSFRSRGENGHAVLDVSAGAG